MSKAKKNKQDKAKLKILLGKKIRYIGLGGKVFRCPSCSRTFKRGMVSEYNNIWYCSEECIPTKVNQ